MGSLRTKFSVVTVLVLIITLAVSSYFLINRTVTVLSENLLRDALNFADFASENIASEYEAKKHEKFIETLSASLSRDRDITQMRIVDKEGSILFDSRVEHEKIYVGPERISSDDTISERLKQVKPSILTSDNRVIYFDSDVSGQYYAVDTNGQKVDDFDPVSRVITLVYPLPQKKFGIEYSLSYANLDAYLMQTALWMGLLSLGVLLFGIMISLGFVGRIVRPLEELKKGALEIGEGNLDTHVRVESTDEIGVLAETFNSMAGSLKSNTKALLEKERLDNEIHLAAEIQSDFIPKEIPKVSGLDIAASVVPATEIGGDCYDFIKQGDDLMIFIADVSGHGVSAGLVEAITSSLVYTFSRMYTSTVDIMSDMNSVIHEKTRPNVFVTSIMGIWSVNDSCFRYSVAGHDPVIYYDSEIRKCTLLSKGGMALGMLPDIRDLLKQQEICLKTGDVLVLYTDGIPEAWNTMQKQLGIRKFMEIIEHHAALPSAQKVHDGIIADVTAYMGDAKQADDISLVVLKKS